VPDAEAALKADEKLCVCLRLCDFAKEASTDPTFEVRGARRRSCLKSQRETAIACNFTKEMSTDPTYSSALLVLVVLDQGWKTFKFEQCSDQEVRGFLVDNYFFLAFNCFLFINSFTALFAFGLSAKLMPKALELLFPTTC
jgi:hypothetical protein